MKRWGILLAALAVTATLGAQVPESVNNNIITQLQLFPQEKTYTHTDATCYAPGDRIWLKVYVVNALSHEPSGESLYAYVNLAAADGTLLARAKLACRDGVYAGYLDIPANAAPGRYLVCSYTTLSLNTPQYQDITPIYVGNAPAAEWSKPTEASDAHDALRCSYSGRRITVATTRSGSSLTLLAHCRAYPVAYSPIAIGRPVTLHRDSLPQGVVSLLLLDGERVVAERLLFSDNHREQCPVNIAADRQTYAPQTPVTLRLDAPRLLEGETADVSVSVTADSPQRPASIVAHLLLNGDVPGGVDTPERYLDDERSANTLLHDKHWTRYDFAQLLHGDYATPLYEAESTQAITGRVMTSRRLRPADGARVSLLVPHLGSIATAYTDSLGRFSFTGADFAQGTQYILHATDRRGKENVELIVDETAQPRFFDPQDNSNGLLLDHLEMMGTPRSDGVEDNVFALTADFTLDEQSIHAIDAACVHDLIRHLPGVRLQGNRCYLRTRNSIYGDTPASIAIDGVIAPHEYDLDNIIMQDVTRIEMFKSGTSVIWGTEGGSGVISITTKAGNHGHDLTLKPNQKRITPLGYQRPATFTPTARTIYWNPNVTGDTITFTAPAKAGTCRVVIDGVTSHGRLIHQEATIPITQ